MHFARFLSSVKFQRSLLHIHFLLLFVLVHANGRRAHLLPCFYCHGRFAVCTSPGNLNWCSCEFWEPSTSRISFPCSVVRIYKEGLCDSLLSLVRGLLCTEKKNCDPLSFVYYILSPLGFSHSHTWLQNTLKFINIFIYLLPFTFYLFNIYLFIYLTFIYLFIYLTFINLFFNIYFTFI